MYAKLREGKIETLEIAFKAYGMKAKELRERLDAFKKLTKREPVMFATGKFDQANRDDYAVMFSTKTKVLKVGTRNITMRVRENSPRYFDPDAINGSFLIRAALSFEERTKY